MSLKRYYNNEVVMGNTPTYGEDFSLQVNQVVQTTQYPLTQYDVKGQYLGGISVPTSKEIHVYSSDNLLKSSYNSPIKYTIQGQPKLIINPESDLRELGYEQGVYSLNYNFLHKLVESCRISEISSDRTEVVLSSNIPGTFENLREILKDNSTLNSIAYAGVKKDLVLNFGENNLANIINTLVAGERTGEYRELLSYPTAVLNGIATTFIPVDANKFMSLDSWGTMVEVYTPALGQPALNAGKSTGRARRYLLKRNKTSRGESKLIWQAGDKLFGLGDIYPEDVNELVPFLWVRVLDSLTNVSYYVPTNERESIYDGYLGYRVGVHGSIPVMTNGYVWPDFLRLEYNSFDFDINGYVSQLIVKLDSPLNSIYGIGASLTLDGRISKSYIEKIIAFPSTARDNRPDFSEPNYSLDMSDQAGASSTNFETWNSLLDVNATTSQQLVNYYFSGSLGNAKLNIDYSDFKNFIHFSTATERVDNFVYKLQQIESYNSRIDLLETVTGSEAITNISQSLNRRDKVIGGFDEFENYLYYNTDANQYTHWSSSAFTIEPYPKSSTFPHILYGTTTSQGTGWYAGVYESASLYDAFNDAALRKMIPIHLQEDVRNEEYITFIDMVGQHFDIQWTYIKSLTDINRREEHPNDGMSDSLLKTIADSLGWKLSNGYSDTNLWKYALGVESDGTLYQSGNLQSKARQQIVNETWRRIVNNIPLLYKTKGTARSIKAILSTYGIPQSFLKIREFGGPAVSTNPNTYEQERFVYKLQASPSKYISNPWDDINGDRPNSVEVIGKMPKAHYHILRMASGSSYVDCFWDYDSGNEQARIRMSVNGSDIISSSYVPYKQRREVAFALNSGSASIRAGWVDDFGAVLANPQASTLSVNNTFSSIWNTNVGTIQVPGPTTDGNIYNYETASIQEIRYFRDEISNEIIIEHAKNREAYFSDDNTTDLDIDTSFDKLSYRIMPDFNFTNTSSFIRSQHPNQRFTTTDTGLILSASLINFNSSDLVGEVDTQFTKIPSMGALNLMNNKIRIESSSLNGNLDPDKSREISEYDYAPNDSNVLGTYFSTTDAVNNDIYNSEGYFEADDWVGDPDRRYNQSYPLLKFKAKNYFQKYTTGTALDIIMDMLSRYDMSVWSQIQQLLPARVDWHKGILIEPHTLERNKYRRPQDINISRHVYSGIIPNVGGTLIASKHDYTSSIALNEFTPSTYRYYIPTLSSSIDALPLSSEFITSSTSLSTDIGNYASDNLVYGGTSYSIINRITNTHLELNSNLQVASGQSGTLYFSGSYEQLLVGITSSRFVTDITNTSLTGSFSNKVALTSSATAIAIGASWSSAFNITQFYGNNAKVRCVSNTTPGGDVNIFSTGNETDGVLTQIGPEGEWVNITPYSINQTVNPGTATFEISFMSSSSYPHHVSSNLVYRYSGGSWPADVAQSGSIVFNDGNGAERTYPILERISNTEIRIDTSSFIPNTSGSDVSSDVIYKSPKSTSITFTIGDPTLITYVTGANYTPLSNGYWEYSPTGSTILNSRMSSIYQVPKYFYSNALSASLKLPSSSSMVFTQVQDTRLALSMENLYYNGCKITSDSLTTDSPDTPDGGPVVEITKVDSNILVYSTQTPNDGGVSTQLTPTSGNPRKTPDDVLLSVNIKNKKKTSKQSAILKASEFNTLSPVGFIPKRLPSILRPTQQMVGNKDPFGVAKIMSSLYSIYGGTNVYLYDSNWNGDWSKLTRVTGGSFEMILNGVQHNKGQMLPTNRVEVKNVKLSNASLSGPSTVVLDRIYVVRKSDGYIVSTQQNPIYDTSKLINVGYSLYDLEIRVVVVT